MKQTLLLKPTKVIIHELFSFFAQYSPFFINLFIIFFFFFFFQTPDNEENVTDMVAALTEIIKRLPFLEASLLRFLIQFLGQMGVYAEVKTISFYSLLTKIIM